MKTLLFVGGCRAGNEFFLSLLDGHSQILQFPGILRCNDNLLKILSHKNSLEIAKNFIKQYKHFFDSRFSNDISLSGLERHDELGVNKKKYYKINEKKFVNYFLKIHKNTNKFTLKKNLFSSLIDLHKAYYLAANKNLKNIKLIIINTHLISYTKYFVERIVPTKNFDIIHTTRHPLSAISSAFKNWIKYRSGKVFFADSIFFQINLIINGIKYLSNISRNLYIIKLESMHLKHKKVLNDFCAFYKIKFEKKLEKSTFLNMLWWGDKISNKNLNGVNKNFKIKFDRNIFYDKDFGFFKNFLNKYLLTYNYKISAKATNFFLNLVPLKCEVLTWKNVIKHKKIKHIILIPYFYLKRIIFINFLRNYNDSFPKAFGELK